MSVWQYVANAETAEGGLTGDRWQAVGVVLGKLHGRLAAAALDASLQAYGRARHESALVLLDRLDEIHQVLRDTFA